MGENKIKVMDIVLKNFKKELNRSNRFMSEEQTRFPEYKYFPFFCFFLV